MKNTPAISPQALHDALTDGDEIALIDVRENGVFGQRHPLLAVNIPLSHLELRVFTLVPRRSVRVVVCDDNEGLAERAARTLRDMGYTDMSLLEGGISAWEAAGYQVYSGVNVISKAFGEIIEQRYQTPHIEASELKARMDGNADLVVLDSRPFAEYQNMAIPSGVDTPGAELVYRVKDLAPDPETAVVVNCAGRTRSIIGCQSLVNAGIPNTVMALKDGTMGWHLAGYGLERGATRRYGSVSAKARAWARDASERVARRFGVRKVSLATVQGWLEGRDERSLYMLDVRQPEEFAMGHLPGSRSAPGGQLVQATDEYLAVRQARVVLMDDTEIRATMTASWLVQMGLPDVYVLEDGLPRDGMTTSRESTPAKDGCDVSLPVITPSALKGSSDLAVVDFADNLVFAAGHIPGACWGVRAYLQASLDQLPVAQGYVVTAPDPALARLAGHDLASLVQKPVHVLEGGTSAWADNGFALSTGMEKALTEIDDVFEKPYELASAQEPAMLDYLRWEVALVEQVERDQSIEFPSFPGM